MSKIFKNKKFLIIAAAIAVVAIAVVSAILVVRFTRSNRSDTMSGTYYYMVGDKEFTLVMKEDLSFVLNDGVDRVGVYTLRDGSLTLDFDKESNGEAKGTVGDRFINLTYNGGAMRFVEKIKYTVTFQTYCDTEVAPISATNGMSIQPPKDPESEGYTFAGWYTDPVCTYPFIFNSQPVTEDITLYAKWIPGTLFG